VTRPEPLPDTWYSRELPVLREVARLAEQGDINVAADVIAQALGMPQSVVARAGVLLEEDGYLADIITAWGTGAIRFGKVTPKGRREVGQWPSPDAAADRLMAALEQAIDDAEGEQKTRLQKVRDGLAKAGRDVVIGIASGVATGQLGG
jgi:hypothetical protein